MTNNRQTMNCRTNFKRNEGIALFIALVFLLISTLLGVTALKSNFLNEKMTFNSIQREQALEAAEVALLTGEDFVENYYNDIISVVIASNGDRDILTAAKNCTAQVNGGGGVCAPKEKSQDTSDTVEYAKYHENWVDVIDGSYSINAWTTGNHHRTISDVVKNKYKLKTSPKYIVEFMGFIVDNSGVSGCTGTSIQDELNVWPYCSLDNAQFRITALATVGNYDETRVMLQSTYVVDN